MRTLLDRARIERHLHADEQVSINEWCERRSIPRDSWPEYTGALAWIDLAISRAADEATRTGRARSRSGALRLVCAAFGLDGDSVRRRWERDQKWARDRKRERAA